MPNHSKRFFVHPESISQEYAKLDSCESHHLRHVMRLSIGDTVEVFDGEGNLYRVVVDSFDSKKIARLKIAKKISSAASAPYQLSVVVAMPQRGKMDSIVEKATELGLEALIPVVTERTVVRPSKKSVDMTQRWKAVSIQAAKQSHLLRLPCLEPVCSLSGFINSTKVRNCLLLVPHPEATRRADCSLIASVKSDLTGEHKKIILFIGPEGGFTEGEIKKFKDHDAISFSTGDTILKIDTAFVAATSFIKFGLGL